MFLHVENLSIDLGEFKLDRVSLNIRQGEYLILIGPTGSGKTILLETIAGFYRPSEGRIILRGKDITSLPPEDRNLSVVYQDYMLFPHMSVLDNISYGLKRRVKDRAKIEERVEQVSKILKISHLLSRYPETLSGGEQQRVAIARALIVKPDVLLMDEPFSALDTKTRESLRSMVKDAIREYETTVIHVSHDFEDVFSLATRVAVFSQGRVIQVGTPEEIFSNPSSDFVADFVGTNILRCICENSGTDESVLKCGDVHILTSDPVNAGEEVSVAIRPENIIITRERIKSSARNQLTGRVESVITRGHVVRVIVDVYGTQFKVIITPNSAELLDIKEGADVYLVFKASGVRVIR